MGGTPCRRRAPRPGRARPGVLGVGGRGAPRLIPLDGRVAEEISALAATGMRPHDALAAGPWGARAFLGLPGLVPGTPADVVSYDQDPRGDLSCLDHPSAIVLRGRIASR